MTWREWIGRQSSRRAVLDPVQADRMNVTLDRLPGFRVGDELPLGWQWLFFHDLVPASQLGPEGHPQLGLTMPPVPLPRRMWAGGVLEFRQPLVLGREVERVTTIAAIDEKHGRTGPLFFVTVTHQYFHDGAVCLAETQTIVYRELAGADSAMTEPAPMVADFSQLWELDSTALFRYSALTFNGHRIHYDADYCREVEGYPNLVIHGPLLATLLLDLAGRHGEVQRFSYQAQSPVFLPEPVTVAGVDRGGRLELWAVGERGLAMSATAEIGGSRTP